MNWDAEVDMVCTGSGAAGLASAISVVDVGGDVFVAGSAADTPGDGHVSSFPDRRHPWLGVGLSDTETNDYFAALSDDLGPMRRSAPDIELPIRVVCEPTRVESGRTVAPFVGARLRDWAARCLASPYGYLYTRVSDWHSTTLHTADGDMIAVAEIGSMTPDCDDIGGSVHDWLTQQARDRSIEVHPDSALQRIVFDEGAVVGAVFTTPDGPLAIRARHGVTVAAAGAQAGLARPDGFPAGETELRVCLVGQHASRFGRIELLSSEPLAEPVPPTCRPVNPRLHVSLHETHDRSHPWRCGKVHGHPSFGQ